MTRSDTGSEKPDDEPAVPVRRRPGPKKLSDKATAERDRRTAKYAKNLEYVSREYTFANAIIFTVPFAIGLFLYGLAYGRD